MKTPKKRRRRSNRIFCLLLLFLLIGLLLRIRSLEKDLADIKDALGQTDLLSFQSPEDTVLTDADPYYVNNLPTLSVEKPVKRSPEEALEKLRQLAETDAAIARICSDPSRYPAPLLAALANNPEMTDFVAGYPDADPKAAGCFGPYEKTQPFPLLLQWDPRWGYRPYGDESILALSGCGPTCLSMVLFYLTGNETMTPAAVASYSMKNGYYVEQTGTSWALMQDLPKRCGLTVTTPPLSENAMQAALDQGNVLICALRAGDFTSEGHFIVVYGYDQTGFFVNDPNCVSRSRQTWTYEALSPQIRNLWAYA